MRTVFKDASVLYFSIRIEKVWMSRSPEHVPLSTHDSHLFPLLAEEITVIECVIVGAQGPIHTHNPVIWRAFVFLYVARYHQLPALTSGF